MRAGESLPARSVQVTLADVVRWSGAIDDYTPIHFDAAAANARGMPGPLVNGTWKAAVLARLLSDWAGESATLTRLSCRYRHPDLVGAQLTCGGTVTAVTPTGGVDEVECELWVADAGGKRTVTGTATLRVRRREATDPGPVTLATEELKAALKVGSEAGRFTYPITLADLDRYREAVGDPALGHEYAPPAYFGVLDPVERRELQLDPTLDLVPYARTGGGNAFNEVEYERPLRAGDVITVATSYTDVYERDGRAGRLLFRVRTNHLYDQQGALVARTRMGHVLAFDLGRRIA